MLGKWAKKDKVANKELKRLEEEGSKGLAPVGSLMFSEVERRIDVVIFRACLAHSVYEARRLVVHGDVLLNGKKVWCHLACACISISICDQHQDANTRLAPGDMVSVDPKAIRFLQPSATQSATKQENSQAEPAKSTEEHTESPEENVENAEAPLDAPSKEPKSPEHLTLKTFPASPKWQKADMTPFNLPPFAAPFIFIPAYLEPSFSTCSVIYLRHPTARPGYSEIPTPWDADGEIVRLAWEWYSKVRPRMRSKSQLARMPENRQ